MKRILVALDASDAADLVLRRAVELARSTNAKVRLLRVVPDKVEPPPANVFEPVGDTNALIAGAETDLLFREREVPQELRDGVTVELGDPWDGICKAARAYKADVVVIGAHRYGVLDRVLGTTAARVVNHIDRPVFVVRPKAAKKKVKIAPDDEKSAVPKEQYAILEAAALAGAASGAAVGALAGPPGMIIGGTIGTAVGMLAGSVLDEAGQRSEAHERELDDAIGVTHGDLGARDEAKAGLDNMEKAARGEIVESATSQSAATLLRTEHARLEGIYSALLSAYREGDWPDVRAQWAVFESTLRAHMELEEERAFPAFREVNPTEAAALASEHEALRKLLETLGICIDLHSVTIVDAEELVRRLREHSAREERIFYAWLEANDGKRASKLSPAA